METNITIPDWLHTCCERLTDSGATPIIVGGAVRDSLLNLPIKDIDIEVFNITSLTELEPILATYGTLNHVGKQFGVLKLNHKGYEVDFSLPRTETSTGDGHKAFDVKHESNIDYKTAASRRDFTINSMGWDPLKNTLLDPYNGQIDLKNKQLRAVGDQFEEDPLRVLRAMQFAARFECEILPETLSRCKKMTISHLPKERLFDEFKKCLLQATRPSCGLKYISELGLESDFPELAALITTPQDPEWHPEGNVWVHTLMVVDEMATLKTDDEFQDGVYMFAALCHDMGKPTTTTIEPDHIRSRGHEAAGVGPTTTFITRLTDNKKLLAAVLPLVEHHLKPTLLYKANLKNPVSDNAIRRLSTKVCIDKLVRLATADHFGRGTPDALARDFPAGDWLLERAKALEVTHTKPKPYLTGAHLLELGLTEGPELGNLLKTAYDRQLDGKILSTEDAITWVKTNIDS